MIPLWTEEVLVLRRCQQMFQQVGRKKRLAPEEVNPLAVLVKFAHRVFQQIMARQC